MADFYEDDEPVEDIIAVFDCGDKKTTTQDYRKLLGKDVTIRIDKKVWVSGKLLAISEMGEASYQKEDGDVWWCWPVLEMWELKLPGGLCPNREDHEPHGYWSRSLGAIMCHADQSRREPYASERRKNETHSK